VFCSLLRRHSRPTRIGQGTRDGLHKRPRFGDIAVLIHISFSKPLFVNVSTLAVKYIRLESIEQRPSKICVAAFKST